MEIYDKLGISPAESKRRFAEYIEKNRDKLVPPDLGDDRMSPRELNEMTADSWRRSYKSDPSTCSKLYFFNGLGRMEEVENEEFWKEPGTEITKPKKIKTQKGMSKR